MMQQVMHYKAVHHQTPTYHFGSATMPARKDIVEEDFQWGRKTGKDFHSISNFTFTLDNHIIGSYDTQSGYSVTITKAGNEKTG